MPSARERNVGPERPRCTLRAVAVPDDTPTSFGHHPGLQDREPEARELADVLRRLIRLSVSTAPPAAETARAGGASWPPWPTSSRRTVPEVPLPRFIGPGRGRSEWSPPLGGAMPYDVVVGAVQPDRGLPVVLDFEPPRALGRAIFDVTYEGAPGCVHGAVLAATFDIILTAANAIAGATGRRCASPCATCGPP